MASKGPRSKLDHDTRARRQKALEAPREPPRPKTHWDHVLEEMVWLSKDFESERKWKLAQAKKVAIRASKGMLDQATRGEKKLKEEEQKLRKIALGISKDVKKFWTKIEKLVLYKHQMELDEKKKKALDKQLEFLLGQTERYSTMLAENLVDTSEPMQQHPAHDQLTFPNKADDISEPTHLKAELQSNVADNDEDYDIQSGDEEEDDEHTLEEDEALITEEERQEELAALHNEIDVPLEELLKRYTSERVTVESSPEKVDVEIVPFQGEEDNYNGSRESSPKKGEDGAKLFHGEEDDKNVSRGSSPIQLEDGAEPIQGGEHHDTEDRNDLSAVSNIGKVSSPVVSDPHCEESNGDLSNVGICLPKIKSCESKDLSKRCKNLSEEHLQYDFSDEQEDGDFDVATGDEKDDEATLSEEEDLAKDDSKDSVDEIALLQKESEVPVEELLARYRKDFGNGVSDDESEYASSLSEDHEGSPRNEDIDMKLQVGSMDENAEHQRDMHFLTGEDQEAGNENQSVEDSDSENRIADAAAAARSAQPTGNTFSTTKVRTKFPFLIKFPLREYQHIGLDWLVTMYEKRLNGILADEMGLGKTIMTIALLAHLACEKGIWGPHLIVVPTSVMLNWETEFLKWCPAFKILTYFGSARERKFKRQGWLKPNSFHVCITTYRLVIQDSKVFKRKKWKYLILDEAHLIKNWKSQRWQTLLNFNSKRRILLTGTPLQNDLMELWSLMHFLMPHIFQSHQEFKDWFCNPISGMVEGQEKVNKEVVDRLHNVLRPFILRRLKRDVEKQLPSKHEHVIYCRLSKRQRNLYEDFIASSDTQATLASTNFFGMISVIMQLRKVCNHPDLFEGRPIVSSYDMSGIEVQLSSYVCSMLSPGPFSTIDLRGLGLVFTHDCDMTSWESDEVQSIATPSDLIRERTDLAYIEEIGQGFKHCNKQMQGNSIFYEIRKAIMEERFREAKERAASIAWWNSLRCRKKPIYSSTLKDIVTVKHPIYDIPRQKANSLFLYSSKLADIVLSPVERFQRMIDLVESFMFVIPAARAPAPACWCCKTETPVFLHPSYTEKCSENLLPLLSPIRPAIVRRQVYFPDRRLIQFDCGKLQELAVLLRKLKSEGHRALIFTQMTKMLDVLEAFINLYGYTYMRLDGSTPPEERQTLMQRFNTNPKYFLFILSTRSGGVGINLVGADTVIFYDSDWNPAMDQQAQDRCHRIGQTREVHIYRLISECTIEENILKKANQKRALDDLVIQSGGYNTEFFKKLDPMELFSGHRALPSKNMPKDKSSTQGVDISLSTADVEAALKSAEDEADYMALKKVEEEEAVDNQEFTEEAIGRLEDDELVNEDEMKPDEPADTNVAIITSDKDSIIKFNESELNDERALIFAGKEDDADMLDDVKQMAAAAAASGQEILSFEDQLRPIERYAIRFLELWDPIIDKAAVESQVRYEETEWELDRIERYKEEMEAEIDDDEEPLVYESWDADFATEAYRQQVEALAQHQLMEELENEAKEKEDAANENFDHTKYETPGDSKPKSKKKTKKTKFKSLKKRSLASELKSVKEEQAMESMSIDDDEFLSNDGLSDSDMVSPRSSVQKKRKKVHLTMDAEEDKTPKKSKKVKKRPLEIFPYDLDPGQPDESIEARTGDRMVVDLEQKQSSRSRTGGKISITAMTVKRVLMIKPEKLKKGNIWSRDCVPSPDSWLPQEDAILCAVVHEYGSQWNLASDALYGMTAGGFYRGRYRHPVHCCERFRELVQKYVLSAPDNPNSEKAGNMGSGKALLKVTEDNIRLLLDVVIELTDSEYLLQRHFYAVLSSVWKVASRIDYRQNLSSSLNGLFSVSRFGSTSINQFPRKSTNEPTGSMKWTNLGQMSKLVAAALHGTSSKLDDDRVSLPNHGEEVSAITEHLEITLEFQKEKEDPLDHLPAVINLSIPGSDPLPLLKSSKGGHHLKLSRDLAEDRFRAAADACVEDTLSWASSTFPTNEFKSRSASKSQPLGKHKLSITDSARPSKSKSRKTLLEHSDMCNLTSESIFLPDMGSTKNSNLRSDLTPPPMMSGVEIDDDTFSNYPSVLDNFETTESWELFPHQYIDGLISGLDDCSLLPDCTDIG